MSTIYQRDQHWFLMHPSHQCYQRPPFAQEWPNLSVPPDAVVIVHLINARCMVRVLALPGGPRLADVLDTDPTLIGPGQRALRTRRPRYVWG